MYDVSSRIDRTDGVWLLAAVTVGVSAERAFREVATGEGLATWFCDAHVEPEVGGAIVQYTDPSATPGSPEAEAAATHGSVTEYRSPSAFGPGRFAYAEREWMGPGLPVDPWITSFEVAEVRGGPGPQARVELRSGFEVDSELARESVAPSEDGWTQALVGLAHRLTTFPDGAVGIVSTTTEASASSVEERWARAVHALGLAPSPGVGDAFASSSRVGSVSGTVLHAGDCSVVLALAEPGIGTLSLFCFPAGESAEEATSHAALGVRVVAPGAGIAADESAAGWDAERWRRWTDSTI